MVTTAHHMPSQIPLQNRLGNCSGFDRLSFRRLKMLSKFYNQKNVAHGLGLTKVDDLLVEGVGD